MQCPLWIQLYSCICARRLTLDNSVSWSDPFYAKRFFVKPKLMFKRVLQSCDSICAYVRRSCWISIVSGKTERSKKSCRAQNDEFWLVFGIFLTIYQYKYWRAPFWKILKGAHSHEIEIPWLAIRSGCDFGPHVLPLVCWRFFDKVNIERNTTHTSHVRITKWACPPITICSVSRYFRVISM